MKTLTLQCLLAMQVGKVSMEWLAGEKTKVVGTYPPTKKGWTGYIEKDTAGQTNIYSVEVSMNFPVIKDQSSISALSSAHVNVWMKRKFVVKLINTPDAHL